MEIGYKIKILRKQRGFTQEQLANNIGVSFQAVSKWENNISLPDITIAPILASFFGVSLDELFDFSTEKIREEALKIARASEKYRETDQEEGIRIIEEGLKQYPNNDVLLDNLLYLINYKQNPDKTISVALKVIDITADSAIKYDALRFLAYAYKAKGDLNSARAALEQIPEIYFSKLSEMAYILNGEEKMKAAQMQKRNSIEQLVEMITRIAECYLEMNDKNNALNEYETGMRVLNTLDLSHDLYWNPYRKFFQDKIEQLKN